ncbi:Gfo/Idh/MocA family protein [Palleronia abyssalis]|uniref:Scyllo-inositol 2-dehydrogenase (NAD(+)) n=1 Tax=Palleronia abyssalis TaxID=1501240 RepID=A0A2R8C069_9RHOB|nr:Gfo/Idh/MocA family oxidoreductase [Palleronia abyssalis]SPJ25821.1 scyllo-inositol 2-dehydrogenase (NAD(+)) [Palleronia abyssalis]
MSTPLRFVVVGLGARSRTWLRVMQASPDVQIVGLADPSPAARDAALKLLPDATVAAEISKLTQMVEADVALLVTPPGGREGQIEACLAAKLDILAEKPLADDVSSAARHVRAAEAAGRTLIVGLNFRFLPVTVALKQALNAGIVGAPEFARFTYERWRDGQLPHLNKYPLVMDHPMLWEQSIHHFDLMRHVYGKEVTRIHARTFNPSWSMYRGDANVFALLEFDGGLHVSYQGTWAGGVDRLDFDWRTDCTEGVLIQREMFGDLVMARRHDTSFKPVPTLPHEPWITDAAALLEMAVAAFRGTGPVLCSGRDHLQSLLMLAACIRSSDRRAPVEIEELRQEIIQPEDTP